MHICVWKIYLKENFVKKKIDIFFSNSACSCPYPDRIAAPEFPAPIYSIRSEERNINLQSLEHLNPEDSTAVLIIY